MEPGGALQGIHPACAAACLDTASRWPCCATSRATGRTRAWNSCAPTRWPPARNIYRCPPGCAPPTILVGHLLSGIALAVPPRRSNTPDPLKGGRAAESFREPSWPVFSGTRSERSSSGQKQTWGHASEHGRGKLDNPGAAGADTRALICGERWNGLACLPRGPAARVAAGVNDRGRCAHTIQEAASPESGAPKIPTRWRLPVLAALGEARRIVANRGGPWSSRPPSPASDDPGGSPAGRSTTVLAAPLFGPAAGPSASWLGLVPGVLRLWPSPALTSATSCFGHPPGGLPGG